MEWTEALGWLGVGLLIWSYFFVDLARRNQVNSVASAVLLGYAVLIQRLPFVVVGLVMLGLGLRRLWRIAKSTEDPSPETGFAVIEVDPKDEYLRHILRVHGRDILLHQPGFVWDPSAPEQRAALIERGPETVGVLLFTVHEDGVAQLLLDYVTPRYRNMGPGKYVFSSPYFQNHDIHTVLTPPGMHEAYYARLGFAHRGDRYVYVVPPRPETES